MLIGKARLKDIDSAAVHSLLMAIDKSVTKQIDEAAISQWASLILNE